MTKFRPRLLVTAGPTREMIDPVRFLSNVSTGLMGYEIAREAKRMGFRVTLINGPTALKPPRGVRCLPVVTAREMKQAIFRLWPETDALIMTAAVCDYAPLQFSRSKIKRIRQKSIRFKRTVDILESIGKRKGGRILMGFSLETEAVQANAMRKLKRKNLDYIVANWYGRRNNPFGHHKTSMILIDRRGNRQMFRKIAKPAAAKALLKVLAAALDAKNS